MALLGDGVRTPSFVAQARQASKKARAVDVIEVVSGWIVVGCRARATIAARRAYPSRRG